MKYAPRDQMPKGSTVILQISNKSFDKAYDLYTQSLELIELQRFDEAITCCDDAIKQVPQYVKAYAAKSLALIRQNKMHEALEVLDKSMSFVEENILYMVPRGKDHIALNINHDLCAIYSNRGIVFQKLDRIEDAYNSFKSACDIDPEYSKGIRGMSITLKHLASKSAHFATASEDSPVEDMSLLAASQSLVIGGNSEFHDNGTSSEG